MTKKKGTYLQNQKVKKNGFKSLHILCCNP